MLTLDSDQLAWQRRQTELRSEQYQMAARLRQEIYNKEVTVAMDGDCCTTNLDAQLGTPLATSEVLRRIKLMNPDLIFEVSIRDNSVIGIYAIEKRPHILKLDAMMDKRMIVAMPIGLMPERTVRHVTRERVPDPDIVGHWRWVETFTGQTRGWRMVLLRLLQEQLVTLSQVERYFPANLNSKVWQQKTT